MQVTEARVHAAAAPAADGEKPQLVATAGIPGLHKGLMKEMRSLARALLCTASAWSEESVDALANTTRPAPAYYKGVGFLIIDGRSDNES